VGSKAAPPYKLGYDRVSNPARSGEAKAAYRKRLCNSGHSEAFVLIISVNLGNQWSVIFFVP
jgi:hypothetical protein